MSELCTLEWDGNGGVSQMRRTTMESGVEVSQLPYAVREGYLFLGWFMDTEASQPIPNPLVAQGDATYYAGWQENQIAEEDEESDEDEEEIDQSQLAKRMTLCCVVQPGSDNLTNWISHHLNMGFHRIYLYNDGELHYFKTLLQDHPIKGVKVVDLPYEEGEEYETTACRHCLKSHYKQCGWMAFMGSDEYIVPISTDTLYGLIDSDRNQFSEYDAVRFDLVRYTDNVQLAKDFVLGDVSMLNHDGEIDGPTGQARYLLNCKLADGVEFDGLYPARGGNMQPLNQCLPNAERWEDGASDLNDMYVATNQLELRWRMWKKQRKY